MTADRPKYSPEQLNVLTVCAALREWLATLPSDLRDLGLATLRGDVSATWAPAKTLARGITVEGIRKAAKTGKVRTTRNGGRVLYHSLDALRLIEGRRK